MEKLQIAYIANYLGPEFSAKYCQNRNYSLSGTFKSTAIIRALLFAGHEVTVYSPGITACNKVIPTFDESIDYPEGQFKAIYPTIVSFRKCSTINSFLLFKKIKQELKQKSYDTVIYYNISIDAALCMPLFTGAHKILEYEDNIFNKALRGSVNRFVFFKKRLYDFVIRRTDDAIVVAKGMLNNGEVRKKVLIPGAINEDVINNITSELKTIDRLKPVRLVLAGGTHYSKGPDLLLKSLNYIKHSCELHFYGNGNFDPEVANLMKSIPSHHKAFFKGYVEHNILMKILTNEADILLNSTRNMGVAPNSEGFPFKMMEYAATGRPIVSSAIGKLDDDFNRHITYYEDESPEKIAAAISFVIENYETCALLARDLQARVIDEFSIKGISLKLNEFLTNLSET